jgi:uncharacterized membrane-anchored protein
MDNGSDRGSSAPMTSAVDLLSARDHPLRRALVEELHVRRFPAFSAPLRMIQIVMFTGDEPVSAAREHAEQLCDHMGVPRPSKERYFFVKLAGLHYVWEQHAEFCTYSFVREGRFQEPFAHPLLNELPAGWVAALPGRTIRATQIAVLDCRSVEPTQNDLSRYFSLNDLVCCDVLAGEARLWSNFRLHEDGLGRLLIRDQGLVSAGDTSRLVQRLQELGNYRNMALLGLPPAQAMVQHLPTLEKNLANLVGEIADGHSDDELLLRDLSTLAAKLAKLTADTRYRMSATRAYAQLVEDRLQRMDVRRVPGYQTLSDFTERRLAPAVRTCESFSQRLDDLSDRALRANALLRTRVETGVERQTRDLLDSMNRRTHLQLRLQATLEGVSVFAISYYAIGVLGYLTKPLVYLGPSVDVSVILASAVPIVGGLAWWRMRKLRRHVQAASAAVGDGANA